MWIILAIVLVVILLAIGGGYVMYRKKHPKMG
jgi:flagellar basal body-associated protein FliL